MKHLSLRKLDTPTLKHRPPLPISRGEKTQKEKLGAAQACWAIFHTNMLSFTLMQLREAEGNLVLRRKSFGDAPEISMRFCSHFLHSEYFIDHLTYVNPHNAKKVEGGRG